jgi:hypothetical protein
MAKVSARGATEVARWRNGARELMLTSDGRILSKAFAGEPWKVAARGYDLARAERFAELRSFARAGGR